MATKLTKKEKGFVKDIVKGETGTQAALNNYNTTDINVAASIASENLTKPKIVNALEEALPDEVLAQIHREGLFATKPNFEKVEDGTYENIGDEPDYAVRHKYLDSAYKLKGKYAPEKPPDKPSTNNYTFIFNADVQKQVASIEAIIKNKLLGNEQN